MKNKAKFVFHILLHPADGYWDMKRERRGSLPVCFILLLLHFVSLAVNEYAVGFIFDKSLGSNSDILFLFVVAVAPILLFSLANLSVTTFLEGEATFKDIFMMSCYALTPNIIITLITTAMSNALALEESTYITILSSIAMVWMLLLFFVGIMQIHNYSMSRTIASVILTVIAMAIILFLLLLFLDMISRIFGFGYSIVQEWQTRL